MFKSYFPFGQEIKKVEQKDKTPKKVFVLGVYASAVHARWVDKNGKQIVAALAVASEPEIFWKGEGAKEIIENIIIPEEAGKLETPKSKSMNGPSGIALDNLFLNPLGYSRSDAWLCDLMPYSRVNPNQQRAIESKYNKLISKISNLTPATIPIFRKSELKDEKRRLDILAELEMSEAKTIILLGDLPIIHFLNHFEKKYSKLTDFGESSVTYGKKHNITINSRDYEVIPLCHPRQANKLGTSSTKWFNLHKQWKCSGENA